MVHIMTRRAKAEKRMFRDLRFRSSRESVTTTMVGDLRRCVGVVFYDLAGRYVAIFQKCPSTIQFNLSVPVCSIVDSPLLQSFRAVRNFVNKNLKFLILANQCSTRAAEKPLRNVWIEFQTANRKKVESAREE